MRWSELNQQAPFIGGIGAISALLGGVFGSLVKNRLVALFGGGSCGALVAGF